MSKRELKAYLKDLSKNQLEDQVLDLYARFKPVKTYYNFVFKPNEEKLLEDAKFRIHREYFPAAGRKAKMRRSVAQKFIKHYIQLGVDPYIIAEVMVFNLEVAQLSCQEKRIKQEAFYKSMLKSFEELCNFIAAQGIKEEFKERVKMIIEHSSGQSWLNAEGFMRAAAILKHE